MAWQGAVVLLLVLLCAAHLVWRLMLPTAWRRRSLARLMTVPWPKYVARRMRRLATSEVPACGPCSGCAAAPATPPTQAQVIRVLPARPR